MKGLKLFSTVYLKLSLLAIAVGEVVRVVLLFNEQTTDLSFSAVEWIEIFVLGALNDWCVVTIAVAPLVLFALTASDVKYNKYVGYTALTLLVGALCYVTLFNTIFDEYGSVVPLIAALLLGFWTLSFALRLFCKGLRSGWFRTWFALFVTLYVFGIIMNGVCEFFFWSEFGVRYNFIAVDYLVYTNEVVGNIMESYPVIPMMLALAAVTGAVTWFVFRGEMRRSLDLKAEVWKAVVLPVYALMIGGSVWLLGFNTRFQDSKNVYVNELQATGGYKFYNAFMDNELNYKQFYTTIPDADAAAMIYGEYGSEQDNLHRVVSVNPESRRNIVLITIESMSASFMAHFGSTENITPTLDSLYECGLAFENLYATGNRTVRGLEAVTLSLPPCPGQSIIKRRDNADMYSTGKMLREKGYKVQFFYGGNSYFDNMESFFGGNGYDIIDQKSYTPDEITFANIWGVCDEDAFRKVIKTLNKDAEQGAPFFAHVMTVSNHRPYTYPAGKISIPNDSKSRSGGVMYSDYALGRFFDEARRQPWFDNTVFVVTADHCASSAGKTEIPLGKYHIPAVIFAPGFIAPSKVEHTVSQIDLMPTLFSLLGMSYDSHFFGRDALAADYSPRAFIATYQDLGYLEGDTFTILSPVCRSEQFRVQPTPDDPYNVVPMTSVDSVQQRRAIGYYQTSSEWNKR